MAPSAATSILMTFNSNIYAQPSLSALGSPKGHTCHPGPRGPPACLHPCTSRVPPPYPHPHPPLLASGPVHWPHRTCQTQNCTLELTVARETPCAVPALPAPSPIPAGRNPSVRVFLQLPLQQESLSLLPPPPCSPPAPRKEGNFKLLSRTPLTWIRGEGPRRDFGSGFRL